MLPHKNNQSTNSVPISRVGSSAKLNHLNVPGSNSRPTSRPNTPSSYVTSSLNPTRNIPVTSNSINSKIKNQEEAALFEALPITSSIRDFENELVELSSSISSFKEENIPSHVERLIQIDKTLSSEQQNLRKHQELGVEIETLSKENEDLSKESSRFLKELIACRAELKKLPRLPAAQTSSRSSRLKEIGVQELLDYSMTLAKFSKAPTTASGQMPHPNNFIWPAEDALRRGLLALTSLKSDEVIRAELGEPEAEAKEEKEKEEDDDIEMEDVQDMSAPTTKVHREEHAPRKIEVNKAPQALNLDLFDGDDSDDSD
ncbi:hypothetical protein FT663_04236 [Candidozyma haemuli var. vulneris]|uniref:Mediator of RNA polymerase II transcription subunit 4 n=1 Tax=Candidozyma haemuli TaxID=45357 RepID=A0A2V1AY91_9ASCO|nr:hypothetical protein CXQ85_002796 [[Candida] haemuloni]KAF3987956.1 hypothetical protein FT663_04236 [[Candida] haemuloni var. vulneris]KAF3991029.1 hypothetical protein FT662_01965 [[Candida] haemuloni var. vulneris]PVH23070.1 hypothetical protein CXQ85_002796 [[Candida] haemuloni]